MDPALPTIQSVQAGFAAFNCAPRYKPAVPVPAAEVSVVLDFWPFLSAFSRDDEYLKLDPHLEPVLPVSKQLHDR